MPHNRFFSQEKLIKNALITIDKDQSKHIKVMRKKSGDTIELINGNNQLALAEMINDSTAKIIRVSEKKPPKQKIILAQSFLKTSKLDLILEKATEIGISEFILFKADHSEIPIITPNKLARFSTILISAIKQCGRLDLPKITIISKLSELKKFKHHYLFGDTQSDSFLNIKNIPDENICFLIGPEKGFSSKETAFLKNDLKASGVKINENILRTETAAITASVLLSQKVLY